MALRASWEPTVPPRVPCLPPTPRGVPTATAGRRRLPRRGLLASVGHWPRAGGGGEFDAVVVPGGWCPDFMRRDETMIAFIRKCVADGILLAAICHGGWMLCCTDALRGRKATSFMAIRHDMSNAGAEWIDAETVIDGNLITARKPDDLPAFCRAIIEKLG